MPKSQLSVRQQVGLCLGVLLFFAIAIAISGYAASQQTRAKMTAFASDGATVTGTITDKYIHSVKGNWVYWFDVSFKTQDGKTHRLSCNLANTIWDMYKAGDPVRVTYAKSNPDWFYVAGDAPTDRDVAISEGMFQYGTIAGILLAGALVAFVFWNRGNGIPAPQQPQEISFRPPLPRPRTGFGTRQRM